MDPLHSTEKWYSFNRWSETENALLFLFFVLVVADFAHQYAVYHHFRAKGYVVKEGTKFGGDFLLYKEGPPFYHALYCVRIMHKVRKSKKMCVQSGLKNLIFEMIL